MADDFLSEHEQAEQLKAWISSNWAWILSGVVVGVGLLAGWQYYQRHQVAQAESAANLLDEYTRVQHTDKAKAEAAYRTLTTDFAHSAYADHARLGAAQQAVTNANFAEAEVALRQVANDSKDAQLRQIATLRLARVLLEQHKLDDALALLDVTKAGAFAAQTHEVRGDVLYAKQDMNGARGEYQAALDAYRNDPNADVSLLTLKLSDVSAAPAPAKTEPNPG